MKSIFILISSFITLFTINLYANNGHELFLISNRNIPVENSLFVKFLDPDYEAWSAVNNKFSFCGGYTYSLSEQFGIGINIEAENMRFDNFSLANQANASRISYGTHFQCKYPTTEFHFNGGGFLNLSNLKSNELNFNYSGFEYGLFLGPELTKGNFDFALLFSPKFSYYYSKGMDSEAILILNPRLSIKLTYNLNFGNKKQNKL